MTNEEYAKLQDMWIKATGVKKGSWVKVLRKAESRESGWEGLWYAQVMDRSAGGTFRVVGIHETCGLRLDVGKDVRDIWSFPFFILELAEEPKPEKYRFSPFEQVLVRDGNDKIWRVDLFGRYDKEKVYPFNAVGGAWNQCIPYAGHEALPGTTDEPEDWAKYYDKE